jgi:hypothetical protein
VEVPAGWTITLLVNFDYATASIAHLTIVERYSLLAISQAGQHCWPIHYPRRVQNGLKADFRRGDKLKRLADRARRQL